MVAKKAPKRLPKKPEAKEASAPRRSFPRATLEDAIKLASVMKDKNGGNPWSPDEVAKALDLSKSTNTFFYMAAAARDFGLTEGGRDSAQISLTDLGRDLVYAPSKDVEAQVRRKAFQNVDLFVRVLNYYKGSQLPEMKYLGNTLEREFGIHPDHHEEFSDLFKRNCDYLGIGEGYAPDRTANAIGGAPAASENAPRGIPSSSRTHPIMPNWQLEVWNGTQGKTAIYAGVQARGGQGGRAAWPLAYDGSA